MNRGPAIFDSADVGWLPIARPTSAQFWGLAAVFWGAEFLLAELRSLVDHSPKLGVYSILRIATALFGVAECLLLHWLARSMRGRSYRFQLGSFLAASVLAGLVNLDAGDFLQGLTRFKVSDYGMGWRVYNHTYWVLMFLAWASIYLALRYSGEAQDQERHARMLERFAHDAQLRALRFQVDPHFLFNTLNSVSALVRADRKDDAETMIRRMSDFFRSTLEANPHEDISIGEEIALQRTYLEIERVRFPNLTVEIDLADDVHDCRIPTLLLQPLVENAVKYAVSSRSGPARIEIRAEQTSAGLVRVSIIDDGAGSAAAEGTGTGLHNVRERLKTRFGALARMTSGPVHPRGWQVEMRIPIFRHAGE